MITFSVPSKKRRTSDRTAGKVSEVPGEIQIQQSTSN